MVTADLVHVACPCPPCACVGPLRQSIGRQQQAAASRRDAAVPELLLLPLIGLRLSGRRKQKRKECVKGRLRSRAARLAARPHSGRGRKPQQWQVATVGSRAAAARQPSPARMASGWGRFLRGPRGRRASWHAQKWCRRSGRGPWERLWQLPWENARKEASSSSGRGLGGGGRGEGGAGRRRQPAPQRGRSARHLGSPALLISSQPAVVLRGHFWPPCQFINMLSSWPTHTLDTILRGARARRRVDGGERCSRQTAAQTGVLVAADWHAGVPARLEA